MTAERPFLSRQERFRLVGSTNDVVRDWLAAGVPEVCLAVADEQSAGRGREGRRWLAPPGRALLLSLGFRPVWITPERVWRIAATVALAIADAAEEVAALPERSIRLKWPNDLVVEVAGPNALLVGETTPEGAAARLAAPPELRKLGGILGESEGLGTADPRLVVGLGLNADWPRAEFPLELAGSMTSLREASGGRPIDLALLLDAFLARLEPRILALREGTFDVADWIDRQATTGRTVELDAGGRREVVRAVGVDPLTGALLVADPAAPGGERAIRSGEVTRVRLAPPDPTPGAAPRPNRSPAPDLDPAGAPRPSRQSRPPGSGRWRTSARV
ncbi:MAG TPA: biotin--[acetyl-CoA-carboxylase] ligase [Candidatus Limnocylindrales bacterium]|nr:biotin--[acetyl-CoA-carboxylase] ligase [Candidatus Limnocylindrales bacterium]